VLKRSLSRTRASRRRSRDRVSSELWELVVERDRQRIFREVTGQVAISALTRMVVPDPVCVVAHLSPLGSVKCFGGQTVEHVKDDLMMGRRAPSDERHLVASCWGHNAFVPPSKEVRHKLRAWLKT